MQTDQTQRVKGKTRWPVVGAIAAALAASVCCIGPIVLLALGVSGAWIGSLSALEPYRPIFMVVALAFLGFGFYRVCRKPTVEECKEGSVCAAPNSGRINKVALWTATVVILGLFAYPNIAAHFAASSPVTAQPAGPTESVVLKVDGMTCAGCTATVTKSLKNLTGIRDVRVTLEPPRATVQYNPEKVSVEDMTKATEHAGYPAALDDAN